MNTKKIKWIEKWKFACLKVRKHCKYPSGGKVYEERKGRLCSEKALAKKREKNSSGRGWPWPWISGCITVVFHFHQYIIFHNGRTKMYREHKDDNHRTTFNYTHIDSVITLLVWRPMDKKVLWIIGLNGGKNWQRVEKLCVSYRCWPIYLHNRIIVIVILMISALKSE